MNLIPPYDRIIKTPAPEIFTNQSARIFKSDRFLKGSDLVVINIYGVDRVKRRN